MNKGVRLFVDILLKRFDIKLLRNSVYQQQLLLQNDIESVLKLPHDSLTKLLSYHSLSTSQLGQDLFVLLELQFKTGGYFVEFGATNGVSLSNTFLLEKAFDWTGILAEPAKCWHDELRKNRCCDIETGCVWFESNSSLTFQEVEVAELSTIGSFSNSDHHKKGRRRGVSYNVNTISLLDLLDKYNAPRRIDYLSIDTEGSEYDILRNFNFEKYEFNVITCEHNYSTQREKIHRILSSHGYKRKYLGFSRWDDWYIRDI